MMTLQTTKRDGACLLDSLLKWSEAGYHPIDYTNDIYPTHNGTVTELIFRPPNSIAALQDAIAEMDELAAPEPELNTDEEWEEYVEGVLEYTYDEKEGAICTVPNMEEAVPNEEPSDSADDIEFIKVKML